MAGTMSEVTDSQSEVTSDPHKDVAVPRTVEFEHAFFSTVDGCYFRMLDIDDEPVMVTPLETGAVDLKLSGIIRELELPQDSPDTRMLETVAKALKFVQGIRIGDPIPSELHTGQASWDITDKHRAIAQARLSMQLVTWLTGDEQDHTDNEQLARVTDDPAMKDKINQAFGQAAENLGLGRSRRGEVIEIVDGLSEELAYIEALREQLERIFIIEDRIRELSQIYITEIGITETIVAITRLSAFALSEFRDEFEQIDAQGAEIMAVLRNVAAQIKFIREKRDHLHRRFWAWHDIIEKWEMQPAIHSRKAEMLLQETYHFLAQRYLPQDEWELFSKALERTVKSASEQTW